MARKTPESAVGRATVALACDACGRAPWHSETNPGGPPVATVNVDGTLVRICTEHRACIAAAKAAERWLLADA
jgi:hypothetical protein